MEIWQFLRQKHTISKVLGWGNDGNPEQIKFLYSNIKGSNVKVFINFPNGFMPRIVTDIHIAYCYDF